MKKKYEIDKNSLGFQDINLDENYSMSKVYRYFYSLFQEKKEFNNLVKYAQLFIETIQIISFAFSDIHKKSWEGYYSIVQVAEYVRISTILKYFDYNVYLVVFYISLLLIIILNLMITMHIYFVDSVSKIYQFTTTIIRSSIDILAVVLYISITEILLIPSKCVDGKIFGVKNETECTGGLYYLKMCKGIKNNRNR